MQQQQTCVGQSLKNRVKMATEEELASRRLKVLSGHLIRASLDHMPNLRVQNTSINPKESVSPFRYTVNNDFLSEEQRQFYEKNGYLVVKGLVKEEELKKYAERFQEICDGNASVPFMTIMKDVSFVKSKEGQEERTVNKLQDYQLDPVLSEYFKSPEILKYVGCFTGPDIMAVHTMLINKPPDPGTKTSRHPLHQDLHYFPFRPADRIVCSWTAMEKVTPANGCLVVVPGTHKTTLLVHEYPNWEKGVNKFYHGIRDFDPNSPRVHLEMDAGDTVFFHPILIHGSGANKTKRFRKAISCHYASSHCQYIDIRGTSQENLAEELKELARKRYGNDFEVTFEQMWRLRRVLVQGQEGTL